MTSLTATGLMMRGRSRIPASRRAVAAVSLILALILLQLIAVVVVVAGARDQDLTHVRIQGARALYAAEAGMHMALREAARGADEDGDGGVGTISANASDADNPVIGGIPLSVTQSEVDGATRTVSLARGDVSQRRITASLNTSGSSGRRVFYSQWPNQTPRMRTWSGSWSAEQDTISFGAKQYWMSADRCPTRSEIILAASIQGETLKAAIQSGAAWGSLITATGDCGTDNTRPFAVAYEQLSGRALLVYRSGNSTDLHYRIWNGAAWTGQNSTSGPTGGRPTWISLATRRGSNQAMLVYADHNERIGAMVWDGASFVDKVQLESSAPSSDELGVDAAFEASTGRAMVVWAQSGSANPRMRIWDGAWSATSSLPALSSAPLWIKLAADRSTNRIAIATMNSSRRIDAGLWNGSAWSAFSMATANSGVSDSRCFDVAFEPGSSRALLVYAQNGTDAPQFRTHSGLSWSAAAAGPVLPNAPLLIQLSPGPSGSEIMALVGTSGGQSGLQFLRWNGSGLGAHQILASNVSGPGGSEVFMIPPEPPGAASAPSVSGWTSGPSAPAGPM